MRPYLELSHFICSTKGERMSPYNGMDCDGVNDCNQECQWAAKVDISFEECYDDEDLVRCSTCPKDYGYPKRAAGDIWSASFRCYKMDNGTRRPICAIPCNGVDECPGKGQK